MIHHIAEGVVITDENTVIKSVNPSFTMITGYQAEEVIGKTPRILQSGIHDKAFYQGLWSDLLTRHRWSGEIWNRRKSGDIYPEQLSISSNRGENSQIRGYIAIFSDITRRKEREETLKQLANSDALTGLPNRRQLMGQLRSITCEERAHNYQLVLFFIDLDGFKNINDSLGHDIGDIVLRTVAHRLKQCLRKDDKAARIGGDEFVLVLREITSESDAFKFGERILEAIIKPYGQSEKIHGISASVGIALFPQHGRTPEELLKAADLAMYQAKRSGKNQCRIAKSLVPLQG